MGRGGGRAPLARSGAPSPTHSAMDPAAGAQGPTSPEGNDSGGGGGAPPPRRTRMEGSPPVTPSGFASSLSPSQLSLLGAPAPKSVLSASTAPSDPLPSPDWLPPPTRLRRSPPSHTWFWGCQELKGGDQSLETAWSPAGDRSETGGIGRLTPLGPRRVPARPAAVPLRGGCSESQGGCSRRRIPATPTDGSISTRARPPGTRIGLRSADGQVVRPMRRCRSRQSRGSTSLPPSPAQTQASRPQGIRALPRLSGPLPRRPECDPGVQVFCGKNVCIAVFVSECTCTIEGNHTPKVLTGDLPMGSP
ncbi:basic salivary proline-rich protein 3-like [Cricetulus griseus]|uniref:Basic salivary proline-rich protein 3-like n=1 Tax=Cricetulus griseus TaxID=10029 RepID=A0A9J7JVW2_CRIGR|nr:basic salivary proline-rich protein 3-like [Cricetulus griseus]